MARTIILKEKRTFREQRAAQKDHDRRILQADDEKRTSKEWLVRKILQKLDLNDKDYVKAHYRFMLVNKNVLQQIADLL